MAYVDGFLLPVPRKNLAAYRRMARTAGRVWRELGALSYFECVSDDLGRMAAPFRRGVKLKAGEAVVFSWIVYRSRAQRDRINAKVMKDPRLQAMMDPKATPFDPRRMGWAGFKVLVEA